VTLATAGLHLSPSLIVISIRYGTVAKVVLVAAIPLAATALGKADDSERVRVAHDHVPAGGTFSLWGIRAERRDRPRYCVELDRHIRLYGRTIAYALSRCLGGVPRKYAVRGDSAYSCYTNELEATGGVTKRASRVVLTLSHNQLAAAHLYAAPHSLGFHGQYFQAIVERPARDLDDMHVWTIRAFSRTGQRLGAQRFPRGAASSWGCFGPPPQ